MIKNLAKRALISSGVLRFSARVRGKGVAILMYHSVMDQPGGVADSLGGIVHSRVAFQGQMELLAREFHPVDLEQAGRFVKGEADLPERSVVITFDDGYTDNYEMAMPILNRLGLRAAFYVTVDCVERQTLPWPSRLRYSFRTTKTEHWTDDSGNVWSLATLEDRERAYLDACDQFCKRAGVRLEESVARAEQDLDARLPSETGRLMMTWEQAKGLAHNGHIVGSHTMTHPNMAFLDIAEARRELTESKKQIESRLSAPIDHFSYPCPALFPNWTEQTVEESRRAGYQTGVTTKGGLARGKDNPLELKRVRPTKTVDGLRWNLESAFAGRAV